MSTNTMYRGIATLLVTTGIGLASTGCARPPAAPLSGPVSVSVSVPVERDVTDFADITASVSAVNSVDVKAHVWGYLEKVHFKEGDLVKKGDLLFEIEARPYQAVLDQAKAKVRQDEAQLAYDDAEYQRSLTAFNRGAASKTDLDKATSARAVDIAAIAVDQAAVTTAQLNLEYTKVVAPVSGRVSRFNVTIGNLVQSGDQAGGTLLSTIVSVDPIYAYFDVDEHTIQRIQPLLRGEGEYFKKDSIVAALPVSLGLATETGFPHRGTLDFLDNQVNAKTGTLRVRGVFPNADGVLTPGYFARVRVPVSRPHRALLVSDRAISSDQGQKVLYVLDDKNAVLVHPVRLGQLHDGLREIVDGLKPGERIIVTGLQQVRPGITVEPHLVLIPNVSVTGITGKQNKETGRQGDKEIGRTLRAVNDP